MPPPSHCGRRGARDERTAKQECSAGRRARLQQLYRRGARKSLNSPQNARKATLPLPRRCCYALAAAMNVEVVFIPDLLRHIAKGWSEDQLISGRVATLGRATLSVALPEDATLLALARAVEDAWGTALADQAFRYRGNSIAPRDTETAARTLVELGMPLPPARAPRVLMSAGAPANAHTAGGAQARTATTLRSPTQVEVITQEALTAGVAEETAHPAPAAVTPFTGASHSLNSSANTSAGAELTPAERRERAAAAAVLRAAAARDV